MEMAFDVKRKFGCRIVIYASIRWWRMAMETASVRDDAPRREKMMRRWALTPSVPMLRMSAISLVVMPLAARVRTSRWREESCGRAG